MDSVMKSERKPMLFHHQHRDWLRPSNVDKLTNWSIITRLFHFEAERQQQRQERQTVDRQIGSRREMPANRSRKYRTDPLSSRKGSSCRSDATHRRC